MRMQLKLTLVLLIVGLLGSGTVGGIAYWMVIRDFRQAAMDSAFTNFKSDIDNYLQTYGGWDKATKSEPFGKFVTRIHRPLSPLESVTPRSEIRSRQEDRQIHRPPRRQAPFAFIIYNTSDEIVLPPNQNKLGQKVTETDKANAIPIKYNNETVLYAIPEGEPTLSEQDKLYLQLLLQAIYSGMAVATTAAILTGLILGKGMTRTLTKLTRAIRGMQKNREQVFHVPITTRDELGELAAAFNNMSSELSKAHKELRELSIKDELTGLFNRRHFDEQAKLIYEQSIRYNQSLTVAICDLDHFKRINDQFSHSIGDEVLKQVGSIFNTITRKSDIAARYGGEEFVLIFPNSSLEQAVTSCENIRQTIEEYDWQSIAPDLKVTISIGLCDNNNLGNAEKMIGIADKNLYKAKSSGRNRIVPTQPVKNWLHEIL